jgi:alpha-D-ribose 1-methylphosphonate 5-triphosphate diphosphatase PhnM
MLHTPSFSSAVEPRPENVITIAIALYLNDDDCNEYGISRVHCNSMIHSNVREVSNMDHVPQCWRWRSAPQQGLQLSQERSSSVFNAEQALDCHAKSHTY